MAVASRSPYGERGLKSILHKNMEKQHPSLPIRGAWIEMDIVNGIKQGIAKSLPIRGAWIEILHTSGLFFSVKGRSPYGERGLK